MKAINPRVQIRYRLPFPTPKPANQLESKGAKTMTIDAGFQSKDGVVLAADAEITVGDYGKTYQLNIFPIDESEKCYVAYAGISDFAQEPLEVERVPPAKCNRTDIPLRVLVALE